MADTVRTTVAVPAALLELVDQAVEAGQASSRNEFMTAALRRELAARERAAVDAAFAEMATDEAYDQDVRQLMAEFDAANREALSAIEADE